MPLRGNGLKPCPPLPFFLFPVLAPQVCLGSSLTPKPSWYTVRFYVNRCTAGLARRGLVGRSRSGRCHVVSGRVPGWLSRRALTFLFQWSNCPAHFIVDRSVPAARGCSRSTSARVFYEVIDVTPYKRPVPRSECSAHLASAFLPACLPRLLPLLLTYFFFFPPEWIKNSFQI